MSYTIPNGNGSFVSAKNGWFCVSCAVTRDYESLGYYSWIMVGYRGFQHNINIEEVCNGIVHPITKETITKYTKHMDVPALKDLWVPAMSKELHCLVQGKEGVTVGTNTIFYLTHDEIRCILKDRTVTYAQIVIYHRPQKDDPNQVRIMVGGPY